MKALETPNMPAVGIPSFCTKHQDKKTDCLVDGRSGESTEIFINKDWISKSTEGRGGEIYACLDLVVYEAGGS